jgi:hypothetical protein
VRRGTHIGYWWESSGEKRKGVQLFIYFKKVYDSVKREVLFNILIVSAVAMKLVRLIKMCLNETYSKVHIGKLEKETDIQWDSTSAIHRLQEGT